MAAGGHTDFESHARVENLAAIAFYEKAGWSVTDRLIHTVEHGISYDERVLIKHSPSELPRETITAVPQGVTLPAIWATWKAAVRARVPGPG